jgi:hypothetical protein
LIGTTLSHFKITAKLGEGGMGEVYRAEDTNLKREVAIKVLPEAFVQDPERFARFERHSDLSLFHHSRQAADRCPSVAMVCVLSLLVLAGSASAQENTLVSDRPGFTDSASVIEPRRVQVESGYTYEEAGDEETQSLGEVLVRIGWTERLELRLGLNSYVNIDAPSGEVSGLEDPSIGIRLKLAEGEDGPRLLGPQAALFIGTTLPVGADDLGASHFQPGMKLSLAWTLTERISLGSNLGVTCASGDEEQFLEAVASLSLGFSLNGALGGFVEYYAFIPESSAGSPEQFVDAGFAYVVSNDLQIDLRAGTQVGGGATDLFVGAGLAYRW